MGVLEDKMNCSFEELDPFPDRTLSPKLAHTLLIFVISLQIGHKFSGDLHVNKALLHI